MTVVLFHCRGFLVCKGPLDSWLKLDYKGNGTTVYTGNEGSSAVAEQPEQAAQKH